MPISIRKYFAGSLFQRLLKGIAIQLGFLFGVLFLSLACSKEKDVEEITDDMTVCFSIGKLSGWTRGTENETMLENQICDFAIYLLDDEGVILQKMPVFFTELTQTSENSISTYKVTCTISKAILNSMIESGGTPSQLPVKILMVANWESGGVSYPLPRDDQNLTYAEIAKTELNSFDILKGIPMYGLLSTTIDTTIKNDAETPSEIGTLWLLRSVAKVEILHSLIGTEYSGNGIIKDIDAKLLNIPINFFSGPSDYFIDTDSWIIEDVINPLTDSKLPHLPGNLTLGIESPKLKGETMSGENTISFYPPEVNMEGLFFYNPDAMENSSRPVIRLDVKVAYSFNGEELETVRPFYLQFANYDASGKLIESQPWPRIVRNTSYTFEIQGIASHEILFKISVEPWVDGGEVEIDM